MIAYRHPAPDPRDFLPDPINGGGRRTTALASSAALSDMGIMQDRITALRDLALRHAAGPSADAIPGVGLHVIPERSAPNPSLYRPMLCVVLQGAKQSMIGDRTLRYDPASYFVSAIDLPASGCVLEASPERPYVAVSLAIDPDRLSALLRDAPGSGVADASGFAVSPVTPAMLDAWSRLIGLIDAPDDIAVLAPLVEREILYRALRGPHGGVLRQAALADSRLTQVRQATEWIKTHFDRPLRMEQLADLAGMSPASFHRHFRAATAMSPLQYQKALRLQEARRLLIADADAARAGYAVGYESASQFSREYARMFGAPPARDATWLRRAGVEPVAAA